MLLPAGRWWLLGRWAAAPTTWGPAVVSPAPTSAERGWRWLVLLLRWWLLVLLLRGRRWRELGNLPRGLELALVPEDKR